MDTKTNVLQKDLDQQAARWVGVGQSDDLDPVRAGKEAASSALAGRSEPQLLIVFSSDAYDLERLVSSIADAAPDVPLIGCSTAGEIATDGPTSASVVVTAMGGEGLSVSTAVSYPASSRLRGAGAEVAACAADVSDSPHRVLLLLSDGLSGDQQEIVRGAYSAAGADMPMVGGCAGDDLKMQSTAQFFGRRVLHDAVVGAAIGSEAPLGIGVRHGWRRVGEPLLVTRSGGNKVFSLDDRPALDVYLERLQAPAEAHTDPAAFTRFAATHPLGLAGRTEPHVRFVGEADFVERSLGLIAEAPQGALAWFMEGDADSVMEATDAACAEALKPLEGRDPLGLIAFDCIARRGVLGEEGIHSEIARISQHSGGAPVAGFYTYGEIARTQGVSGFHNQTLVVLALS